jgi:iron complex transport system ATP-binding protein
VLITHHVEEIIPEINRVIFLKHGRTAGDGTKTAMLTDERLTGLFDGPLAVSETDGYFHVHPQGSAATTSAATRWDAER